MRESKYDGALGPYRALDLTDQKGLLCGKILADLGVDVIKVEKPGGDPARCVPPFYGDLPDREKSLHWFAYNVNKRGITLDIETKDGNALFRRLVQTADFVIESFAPGYLDSCGLGYSTLCKLNPRIILTSITPFGQSGPYRDYKASDIVCLGSGGLMAVTGDADRPPLRFSVEQAYCLGGAQAAAGTLIAHYFRQATGEGQHVDVSIQESVTWTAFVSPNYWEISQYILRRSGQRFPRPGVTRRLIFSCKDGYVSWQLLPGTFGPKTRAVVEWMESEGVNTGLKDMRWEQVDFDRMNQQELEALEEPFVKFFSSKTKAELWEKGIEKDTVLTPVNSAEDVLHDVQLAARGFWMEIEHPNLGVSLQYPGPALRGEPLTRVRNRPAPLIGEYNEEIFRVELGLTPQELSTLMAAKVI